MRADFVDIDFMEYDLKTMGTRIRKRREEMKLKQKDIAEILNVVSSRIKPALFGS